MYWKWLCTKHAFYLEWPFNSQGWYYWEWLGTKHDFELWMVNSPRMGCTGLAFSGWGGFRGFWEWNLWVPAAFWFYDGEEGLVNTLTATKQTEILVVLVLFWPNETQPYHNQTKIHNWKSAVYFWCNSQTTNATKSKHNPFFIGLRKKHKLISEDFVGK